MRIIPYQPRFRADFDRLNRAWLVKNDLLEPPDVLHLEHPEETILGAGGQIFLAMAGRRVVGTAAAIPHGPGTVELAKFAVDDAYGRQGIGRRLAETTIEWARTRGAHTVMLVSNHRLDAAIRLYGRLGFAHVPVPDDAAYRTADVCMELRLEPGRRGA